MSQIYLIKSGVMLEAVKQYIEDDKQCKIAYSKFAESKGSTRYFHNSSKVYGLEMRDHLDGWTKPSRKSGESHPKKGSPDLELIQALPKMPNKVDIIKKITGVPLSISHKSEISSGHSCIGSPLNECGFLYISRHDLHAFWTPDLKKELSRYEGSEITNGADKWSMDIEGVEAISESKWDLLVAQCKVKDEEE